MTIEEIIEKHKESNQKENINNTLSYLVGKIAMLNAKNMILENALKEKGINIDYRQEEIEEYAKTELVKMLAEIRK